MIVVLEGLDGSGKSTVAQALSLRFQRTGEAACVLRDPGSSALGEQLRTILLDANYPLDPVVQTLLFSAARTQLATEVLRLSRDQVVILDRWWMSTYAYQGAQGVDREFIREVAQKTSRLPLEAGLSFFLDVPLEVSLLRSGKQDRFEGQPAAYRSEVRKHYISLMPAYLTRINAARPLKEVVADVWGWIQARMEADCD